MSDSDVEEREIEYKGTSNRRRDPLTGSTCLRRKVVLRPCEVERAEGLFEIRRDRS
jgi:hypothetical protein